MSDVKTDEINFDDIELDEGFDEFDTDELDLDLNMDENIDDSLDDSINDSDSDLADITFDDEQFSTEEKDNQDDILEDEQESQDRLEDYTDGTVVEDIDLHEDEEEMVPTTDSDFINDSGSIVVQDSNDDRETGFNLIYLNIEQIAITQRIRKMKSVEGLVKSIQSTGLLKPLVVAPTATEGLYVLLDGYRRIQACARAGITKVPCIVNNRVNTPEIPMLEALYNHSQKYSIKEQIDYINYLEVQKGIMNPAMIEYLLQMNSGDYTKLKDILNDNDDDIVTKLMDGVYDIPTAFKKLEQRRKKESAEEKEDKKANAVYSDEEESGANQLQGAGEEADGEALTEEQIKSLAINPETLDEDIEDTSLSEMIEEDKKIEGFEPHKQKVGEREFIDPIIKKSVMARDNNTCQCCKRGGEQYVDILDFHHIVPIMLGGVDSVDNGIMLCVACHRLVHLYSTDDLHIDKALLEGSYDDLTEEQKTRYENEEIFEDEQRRFKRIITLGSKIRQGIAAKGMNKKKYKEENPNTGIGRRKPGVNAPQEKA